MSEIDNQIDKLRERLAYLEEQKAKEEEKKAEPLNLLESFIDEKKDCIKRDRYSKSLPLARFYDQEKVEYLKLILNVLKNIEERLEVLENNKKFQDTVLSNINYL
jgi:uncharacterized coiled-coil protein SlyX